MRYNILGRSGLYVSELCLGTMTFGGKGFWEVVGKLGNQEVEAIAGTALDAGVNFLDTADVYSEGASERLLGAALKTAIPPAIKAFEAAADAVKAAACVGGTWGEETIDTGRGISDRTMDISLRRSAWRDFIKALNLDAILTAADKKHVEQMLVAPLPFDTDSLRAVFGDHIANPRADPARAGRGLCRSGP